MNPDTHTKQQDQMLDGILISLGFLLKGGLEWVESEISSVSVCLPFLFFHWRQSHRHYTACYQRFELTYVTISHLSSNIGAAIQYSPEKYPKNYHEKCSEKPYKNYS